MFSLEGRTAVITGGTRGIGAAMAIALAEAGADIILVQVWKLLGIVSARGSERLTHPPSETPAIYRRKRRLKGSRAKLPFTQRTSVRKMKYQDSRRRS